MRERWLMGILCLMSSLPPLSIDMGLPAVSAIQAALGGAPRDQELLLTVFMAGFAVTPLFFGILSDRVGRKPVLYAGLGLFTLAGVVCALAPSMGILLTARFIQGSGAGAGISLAFAILRDRFNGPDLGARISVVAMLLNTAPMVAPSIGALLLIATGWRSIFGVLATIGALVLLLVIFLLPETKDPGPDHRADLLPALKALITHPSALGYAGVYGIGFGSAFAYIASSSLLLIGYFHLPAVEYALLFALTAGGATGGAFVSGRLIRSHGGRTMVLAGLALSLIGPAAIAASLVLHRAHLAPTMAALIIATFGNGLINPAASQGALSPFAKISGLVGALITTLQMGCAALSSGLVAVLWGVWGVASVPAVMLIFAFAASLIFALAIRPTRQKLN